MAPGTAGGRSSAIPTRWPGCEPSRTSCRPRSRSSCGTTRRCRCSSAGSSSRSRSTASRSRAARRSRCCSGRPTATPTPSSTRTVSTSRATQPVPVLRGRDPLLPGRAAREDGAGDRVRDAAAAAAGARARRGAALEADLRAARARVAPGPALAAERRCATSRSATRTPSGPRSPPPSAGRSGWWRRSGRPTPHGWSWWPTSGSTATTSADLIRDELPALAGLRPDLVSVLIGVNDVVRGVPPATYAANLERILDALLDRLPPDRIVTVTIPDYTVTPAGADYGDPRRQHDAIVAANATMTRLATNAGIACVDIFDLSERAGHDRTLVAARRAPPERRAVRRLGGADRTHRHRPHRRLRR